MHALYFMIYSFLFWVFSLDTYIHDWISQKFEFQKEQIFGARVVGASVIKTAEFLNVSRGTVFKIIVIFEKPGKTSSSKHNPGRKTNRSYHRIVNCLKLQKKAELNRHIANPVSAKTVRC